MRESGPQIIYVRKKSRRTQDLEVCARGTVTGSMMSAATPISLKDAVRGLKKNTLTEIK